MALTLLLARQPRPTLVTFADPASRYDREDLLRGVASEVDVAARLVYPLPDASTRRHPTAPRLLRQAHADLWTGLTAEEREHAFLVTGPTACLMARVTDRPTRAMVALGTRGGTDRVQHAWRYVLAPFPQLDEIPLDEPPDSDRERWAKEIKSAARAFDLLRSPDRAQIALEVASGLGMRPKQAARVAAASLGGERWEGPKEEAQVRTRHWIEAELAAVTRAPTNERPKRLSRSHG